MSEMEMILGRNFGASYFFVYQTIKHNPNITARHIEIETGLSESCVQKVLTVLRETNVVKYTRSGCRGGGASYNYKENEMGQWRLQ